MLLEKMNIIPKPQTNDILSFKAKIKPEKESGSEVLSCVNLKIGYDINSPLATIDLKLLRGERLGIIGANGTGKSTLLQTITDNIPAISGHYKLGYNVEYGYFSQLASKHNSTKTIYQEFSEEFSKLNDQEVRSKLGAFLFSGSDVNKKINSLSGGELVRLELCKIFERKPNLLILDEPTNHMDIASKETLENMLLHYTGTIIFVSHDRYFTNKIATKLLIFENGSAKVFDGTYNEYTHPNTKIVEKVTAEVANKPKPQKIEYPVDYDEIKEDDIYKNMSYYDLSKEKNKAENILNKIESKSTEAEQKLKQLNQDFVDPEIASDFVKLMEIQAEIEKTQITIDKLANDWLEKNEELAKINSAIEEITTKKDN